MKVVTWNVNSVRARSARLDAFLARHQPDLVCLQETKVLDDQFPAPAVEGYRYWSHGQAGRNGVALVSRHELADVQRGFPGDPSPDSARVISASLGDVRVIGIYVVNGQSVGSAEYELKLQWLDALGRWVREAHSPVEPLLVAGDFNIAPTDDDIYDPAAWEGQNLASGPERERLGSLLRWGLTDLMRLHHQGPGPYTFWDYRAGAFHRGWGLRIDLALATQPLASRSTAVEVERDERKPTFGEGKPSDHAPLILTFE
ncbi:MAG: exodeoxyribonuclease III [Dehalococcoidia bacterium]|nr:exodeoxyribonuclease III [Dehalococcoidia bacterium]